MIMAQHQCELYGTRSIFHKIMLLKKIFYLPQINQSLTSTSVVSETMSRSLKIPLESQKENIFVTYNLAIEKLALQIQAEEKPTFDKIFISEMVFLSVPGKIIEESGGPHILDEYKILAKVQLIRF